MNLIFATSHKGDGPSAQQIATEIRATGQPYAVFTDNNLGSKPEFLYALCRALRPLNRIWSAAVSIDVTDDPALVREMAFAPDALRFFAPRYVWAAAGGLAVGACMVAVTVESRDGLDAGPSAVVASAATTVTRLGPRTPIPVRGSTM